MSVESIIKTAKDNKMTLLVPNAGSWYYVESPILGQYTVTCPSTTILTIMIPPTNPEASSTTFSTTSGVLTFTVSQRTMFYVRTDTGTNISVLFQRNTEYAGTSKTSTLDTITNSGAYTATGSGAIVLLVGGGNGGSPGGPSFFIPYITVAGNGGPGGSGGASKLVYYGTLPGNVPVTIGAGGPTASAGGTTSFDIYSAPGGGGGSGGGGNSQGGSGSAGGGAPLAPVVNPLGLGVSLSATGGAGGIFPGNVALGGGIGAGGGGGAGGRRSVPGPGALSGGMGGAGGGGGVAGANGGVVGQVPAAPTPVGVGGAGGAGRVWVLRY